MNYLCKAKFPVLRLFTLTAIALAASTVAASSLAFAAGGSVSALEAKATRVKITSSNKGSFVQFNRSLSCFSPLINQIIPGTVKGKLFTSIGYTNRQAIRALTKRKASKAALRKAKAANAKRLLAAAKRCRTLVSVVQPTPTATPRPSDGSMTVGLPFSASDIAVNAASQSFAIGAVHRSSPTAYELWGACFESDFAVRRSPFLIHQDMVGPEISQLQVENPMVATSRFAGRSAVLFSVRKTQGVNALGQIRLAMFNEACQPIGFLLNLGEYPGDPYQDIAMDDAGRVAVIATGSAARQYTRKLFLISPQGILTQTLDTAGCGELSNGTHVALNRTTGDGVVTCEGPLGSPIEFRRFSANGQWLDADFLPVSESAGDRGSYYDSHAVGMLDDGRFGIVFQSVGTPNAIGSWTLNTYNANGTFSASQLLALDSTNMFDGYRGYHPKVLQPLADGFLVPLGNQNNVVSLVKVSPALVPLASATQSMLADPSLDTNALRTLVVAPNGESFLINRMQLVKNRPLGSSFSPIIGR